MSMRIKESVPSSCEISIVRNMDEAVQNAALLARPKDHVLLSPACASFDMYKNFIDRGNAYKESIRRLIS